MIYMLRQMNTDEKEELVEQVQAMTDTTTPNNGTGIILILILILLLIIYVMLTGLTARK